MRGAPTVAALTRRTALILTLLLLAAAALSVWRHIPFLTMITAIAAVAVLPAFFKIERFILFACFYIISFEIPLFKGELFPVSVNYYVLDALYLLILFMFIGQISLRGRGVHKGTMFGWGFLLIFAVFGTSAFLGVYYGNSLPVLLKELRILGYYGVFFAAVPFFGETRWIRWFFVIVVAGALLAAFDTVYTYNALRLFRFYTRQVHVFLFVIPLLISLAIFDRHRLRRWFYAVAAVPVLTAVLISQTRGSWVGIAIAALLSITLSVWKRMRGRKRIAAFLSLSAVTLIVVLFAYRLMGGESQARSEFTESRVQSVTELGTDYSMMMRVNSYMTVARKIQERPLLGHGLGDTATYLFFGEYSTQNNVDSTYLTILWKMGILGLTAFLLLYTALLIRAFRLYRTTDSSVHAVLSATVLAAFSGYLILGTISPVLITYRFNFFFGLVFAMIEAISLREEQGIFSGKWRSLLSR